MKIRKVVRPGTVLLADGLRVSLFCSIVFKNGRLSISGVEGPRADGNAYGGCGQVEMSIDERYIDAMEFADGWNRELFERFLEVWREWHLNDMHPECKHQRELGWGQKEVELITYRLKTEYLIKSRKIADEKLADLRQSGKAVLSGEERKFFNLEYEVRLPAGAELPEMVKGYYKEVHREKTSTGWLRPDEHPEGVLGRSCPVCGYEYGTRWNTVEVPWRVLEFLRSLPDADRKPAWV